MKFSKQWLQDYIVETLPEDGVVVDTLNKKSFEVEEVIFLPDDTVYDIKVLPNRAHDALGHRGMARELCADLDLTFKEDVRVEKRDDFVNSSIISPVVSINDPKSCSRFMSMRIDGIVVEESPKWLKTRLEAIGQRSINNIVDVTNYVQFSLNKPMHAYDTRSIKGAIGTRFAKNGEVLTTLDEKELALDEKTLVIANDEKALGLAGIKGGKYSGIYKDTNSVILESANFAPSLIRKTSQRYDLHTDASKRFENGIANSLVEDGLYMTANLIKEICKDVEVSVVVDVYPKADKIFKIGVGVDEVNNIIGAKYTEKDLEQTLVSFRFPYEKVIPEQKIKELIPITLGKPYNRFASTLYDAPNTFSCGSLVNWLYIECGQPSPRIALDAYIFSKHINKDDLRFGDLVFTNTRIENPKNTMIYSKVLGKDIPDVPKYTKTVEFLRGTEFPQGIDHVGMYIGNDEVLHTGSVIGKTVIEKLSSSSYFKNECWYGRFIEDLSVPQYVISVPSERLDIRIKEDVAEEIGRIMGYDKLTPVLPNFSRIGSAHKRMYYEDKIREILIKRGFSEVMTYTFGNEGGVSIVKGLAGDKEKLRGNLSGGIEESLKLNIHNAPLLGQKVIKIFEFGNVFAKNNEIKKLAFAFGSSNKKDSFKDEVNSIVLEIGEILGVNISNNVDYKERPCITEINFDALIDKLEVSKEEDIPIYQFLSGASYKTVSPYPFALRDIAVFVESGTKEEEVLEIIKNEAGELLTRIEMFDKFEKDNKISYAFHLVFLSQDKTLSDVELDEIMEKITKQLNSKTGWQVR